MKLASFIISGLLAARCAAEFAAAPKQGGLTAEIAALSSRVAKLGKELPRLAERLTRAEAAVPTPEEFRIKVAEGRKKIEALRADVNQRWKDVQRLAGERGAKLDPKLVKGVVPEALEGDAEYRAAREKAAAAEELLELLEKRLIQVMLTTSFDGAAPAPEPLPTEQAIAREWANLAEHQKSLANAVQNARAKATAAKLDFDFTTLLDPSSAPSPAANRAFVEAREKAAIQRDTRDASAESVASLEFLKAVGPRYVPWK